ncbi:MAG: hypothetical protein M3464_21975 [Chloroflexota bacterium]|nr:hypothetical protein [Chloroflexota bacterium]
MALGLAALQIVLAGTLMAAAAGKLLRTDEFVSALRLSHLPERLVAVLAVLVPGLEVGFAVWLMLASPAAVPFAFVATLVLLILFTTWMGWVRIRRLRVRCGCFGPNGGEVGAGTIGRNLGLIGLAGLGWLVSLKVSTALAGPSLWMVLLVLGFILCIALVSALRFAWPHFTLTEDRLRVGGGAGE